MTLEGKRLARDTDVASPPIMVGQAPAVPATLPRIASGDVTILAIGSNDLFAGRAAEIVGKVCTVTQPLTRDAQGYYAGEVTCGTHRYYFAAVQVARPPLKKWPSTSPGRPGATSYKHSGIVARAFRSFCF